MIAVAERRRAPRQSEEMLPLLVRHKIQVLLEAGLPQRAVAERANVSIDTVQRVRSEPEVADTDDAARRRASGVGRPSKTSTFVASVLGWLNEDAALPTQELLRRAREAGYDGHKTAFYAMVAGIRPKPDVPVVRFEGLPGEFSQHDFGHVDVRFVDGSKVRVHFFASRLKFSRFVVVELVANEQVETIVRGLARAFVAFGGRPLMCVFDRPRTIVKKSGKGRDVEAFNATFAQAIVDLGVGVEMCAPRSGNQKGSVEQLVKWVKNAFFKHRRFVDEVDLRAQLAAWLDEVNTKTPSRATGVIPETRRQEELARLRAIRVFPESLVLRIPVFVGPTAEVLFDGVPYSMQPKAANTPATLYLFETRLRIETVNGRFRSEHRRRTKDEPPAPLPEHRAAKIAAVHGERAKLYAKREALLAIGPDALTLLTEITHRDGRRAYRAVEELYTLLDHHGDDAMREAIGCAVRRNALFVSAVRRNLPKSARGSDGERHHVGAAHTRGPSASQLALPIGRAESKRGAS